ncbi:hypothetical protein COCON_G00055650, partial [Conger conger]
VAHSRLVSIAACLRRAFLKTCNQPLHTQLFPFQIIVIQCYFCVSDVARVMCLDTLFYFSPPAAKSKSRHRRLIR